jgi:hypothetical protein
MTRDTSEAFGIGLMVVDKRFPKLTRPEKLARPLIYMSTRPKRQIFTDQENLKKHSTTTG